MRKIFERKTKQKGFSILELLITLSIFLIAIAAIFGVVRIATIQKNTVNNHVDQLRSARIAVEYIRRDALNAGFGYHRAGGNAPDNIANDLFGLPKDSDAIRDLLTSIIAGNDVSTNTLNPDVNMDMVSFISRDPTFNRSTTATGDPALVSGNLLNYVKTGNNGNIVYVETKPNEARVCLKNELYLLESDSGTTQVVAMKTNDASAVSGDTASKVIEFAVDDPLKVNQSANGTGEGKSLLMSSTSGGTIKKINMISYSVSSDGVLIRKTFGNQPGADQVEIRELVYGVSDFQIKYFMEDGTTVDNPSSNHDGRDNQIKMNSVVQIQVTITITPKFGGSRNVTGTPVTIREYISTRNLRYEAS